MNIVPFGGGFVGIESFFANNATLDMQKKKAGREREPLRANVTFESKATLLSGQSAVKNIRFSGHFSGRKRGCVVPYCIITVHVWTCYAHPECQKRESSPKQGEREILARSPSLFSQRIARELTQRLTLWCFRSLSARKAFVALYPNPDLNETGTKAEKVNLLEKVQSHHVTDVAWSQSLGKTHLAGSAAVQQCEVR
jgi:hypothetical protein